MGSDGASGMAAIHAAGGETMAQDSSTSVIFGMPQRAIERRAVTFIGTPEQIARRLKSTALAIASPGFEAHCRLIQQAPQNHEHPHSLAFNTHRPL